MSRFGEVLLSFKNKMKDIAVGFCSEKPEE